MSYDKNMEYISNNQTLIGTKSKTLIDQETGEVIKINQITKRVLGQKHFWKLYLAEFLQILGVLDSKQVDVIIYILDNTEPANNTFLGGQRDIAKDVGVTIQTVSRVMVKLQNKGFVNKIKNSVYQISPEIMMEGADHKKSLPLNYYNDENGADIVEEKE